VLSVNLTGAFRVTRALAPRCGTPATADRHITSINGIRGKFGSELQRIQGGLIGLTKTLARSSAQGITVNAVAPGWS